MVPGPPRRRRARAVADAPIDLLLADSDELAKGWLLALLEHAPLYEAPAILAADLSRDGPGLCEAVLRAVAADADLRRLEPGGTLAPLAARVGEMAGAAGADSTSRAVDALQAVIWAALRDELRSPDPGLVSDLAERLVLVSEQLRGEALRRSEDPPFRGGARPNPPDGSTSQVLWSSLLEEEIQRSAGPLSLLLAELDDAGRVTAIETEADARLTLGEFAPAVRGAVRRQDILACESGTRAWIVARDTERAGAEAIGAAINEALGSRRPWRGAALVASVGVAVLGEDGATAEELIEAAEEARFAAVAKGISVVRALTDPPEAG